MHSKLLSATIVMQLASNAPQMIVMFSYRYLRGTEYTMVNLTRPRQIAKLAAY